MRSNRGLARAGGVVLAWLTAAAGWADRNGFDLQAAIRSAEAGATIRVPAGRYPAPLIVDRPVVLIADAGVVIDGEGRKDVVHIVAPDVTFRGFTVRGSGDSLDQENTGLLVGAPRAVVENNTLDDVLLGILVRDADQSLIRGNMVHGKPLDLGRRGDGIRLWNSHGCRIENNAVRGVRDLVIWYSRDAHVAGNTVRDSRYGLHFMYANGAVLEDNALIDNSVGIFLMYSRDIALRRNRLDHNRGPSGYGLGLKDVDGVTAEENILAANRVGMFFDNAPSRLDGRQTFRRNLIAFNDVGLAFMPSVHGNDFIENSFVENVEQVAILGSGDLTGNGFTVAGRGNYWSDYAGFDGDGDGLGDVHYRAMSLFENLIDREPAMRLFLYSPAQQAIELAARAFPIVRPTAKVTDDAPLMSAPPLSWSPRQAGPSYRPAPLIAGGALVAALVVLAGRRRPVFALASGTARGDAPLSTGAATTPPRTAAVASFVAPLKQADERSTPVLTIANLVKRFGKHAAVADLSLEAHGGQAVALWGANGAGKTTLIKCILGLHRCRGEIRVAGHDARRRGKAARRAIGYVSQELAFYDDLSAADTTRLFARLKRVSPQRGPAVLEQVGLSEHAAKRVRELSGGMKQRLALAVALLADPPLLLLDEPTSNLDAAARRSFLELLRALKAAGKTIVFSTHRADEVVGLADRVVVLERGRVVRETAPADLAADYRLRIPLAAEARDAAHDVLSRDGFDVSRNGSAVLVRIPMQHNATPIARLARAGIAVETFEIESGEDS